MQIFAIAHRMAVPLNAEYVERRSSSSNGSLKSESVERDEDVPPMTNHLSYRREVQHRWGLHGETPPEPIESLEESDIESILEELETLEHMNRRDEVWFYEEYIGELRKVLDGTPFERFLSTRVPMAYFESDPMSYWNFGSSEFPRLGPRPKDVEGKQWWGSVNLEMGARPLWRYIKSELELDTGERWYRLLPARINWLTSSGETLDAIGRKHLLMGIQDVTEWVEQQQRSREKQVSEGEKSSYFFDPATATRLNPNGDIRDRIEDERRGEANGFLYVGKNEDGRKILQRCRNVIKLSNEVASQMDDSDRNPFDTLERALCGAIRTHLLMEGYRDAIIEMPKDKLLRYAAKNLTWLALTDADMARIPDMEGGPHDELMAESMRLGGVTHFYLSHRLKGRINKYQKEMCQIFNKCFQRVMLKKFGCNVSSDAHVIRTLMSICSRYYSDANALRTVFRSSDLYGSPQEREWQSTKLLLSVLYLYFYRKSDELSQNDIAGRVGRSTRIIRRRINKCARPFVESRDMWT